MGMPACMSTAMGSVWFPSDTVASRFTYAMRDMTRAYIVYARCPHQHGCVGACEPSCRAIVHAWSHFAERRCHAASASVHVCHDRHDRCIHSLRSLGTGGCDTEFVESSSVAAFKGARGPCVLRPGYAARV